jgi:hypothetical protein
MSFKDLKKKSKDLSKITQELDKLNKGGAESYKDDRFWKPELDQASNGFAVIRFLPVVDGEDVPWARMFSHGFQGKGGWFIENCPTTLGKKCPVCEANNELWNSGIEDDKTVARDRKRKLSYVANIYVVSDPKHPENEGKIFLFKFGKKIFDKIMEKIQPEFPDDSPVNVFDFWQGANFKLKIRKVAGYINYDKSEFEEPSALLGGDDAKLEELWKKQYSLKEFTSAENFKSYDELKSKMESVLRGGSENKAKTAEEMEEIEEEVESRFGSGAKSKPAPKMPEKKSASEDDGEEEDALSYFEKLAKED